MILRSKTARLFCSGLAFILVFSAGLFSVMDFNLMDPWGRTWLDVHGTACAGLFDHPVSLGSSSYTVSEGDSVTVQVVLAEATLLGATVRYSTSDGTAGSGDYNSASYYVYFAPGDKTASFTIKTKDDSDYEGNEFFTVSLNGPVTNCEINEPSRAQITILHNDTKPVTPTIKLSSSTYTADENSLQAVITVEKTEAGAASVSYAATAGSAAAGSDFTPVSGTLTFGASEYSKTFIVPLINDDKAESSETVNIQLSSPSGADLGIPSSAVLTITDSDSPSSGSATPEISLSSSTYSVAENAGTATITVTKSGTSAASVSYSVTAGTATAGQDFTASSGTLSFAEGVTSKTITINIIDDTTKESSETVNIQLSSPSGATLASPSSAVLTIADNDSTTTSSGGGGVGTTTTTTTTEATTSTTTSVSAAATAPAAASPGVATAAKPGGSSMNIPEDILGHWGRECILAVMDHAGIYGYSDGTMRPNRPITRAEAAVMIVKVLNLADNKTKLKISPYKDALPSWGRNAILIATEMKLMGGYADHTFKPNRPITRAEICTILMKAFPSSQTKGPSLSFSDKTKIPDWAAQWVAQAVGRSIVGGYPDKTFKASRKVTRAETFTMVCKAAGYHDQHAK